MVEVIAEIGVNHQRSTEKLETLIKGASYAGANTVKFQLYKTADLIKEGSELASYQQETTKARSQYELLKDLEMTSEMIEASWQMARENKLNFLVTPFDKCSAMKLLEMGVERIKVSSGDVRSHLLLHYFGRSFERIILSTGMSTYDEIRGGLISIYKGMSGIELEEDIDFNELISKDETLLNKVTLMHCTSAYPTPMESANLTRIGELRKIFGVEVGYSDHTQSTLTGALAVINGARVIEKHLTECKKDAGPDHLASMEINEMKSYIENIEAAESSMKLPSIDSTEGIPLCEKDTKNVTQRYIFVSRHLEKGSKLRKEDLIELRATKGILEKDAIRSQDINRVIGKFINCNLEDRESLCLSMIN